MNEDIMNAEQESLDIAKDNTTGEDAGCIERPSNKVLYYTIGIAMVISGLILAIPETYYLMNFDEYSYGGGTFEVLMHVANIVAGSLNIITGIIAIILCGKPKKQWICIIGAVVIILANIFILSYTLAVQETISAGENESHGVIGAEDGEDMEYDLEGEDFEIESGEDGEDFEIDFGEGGEDFEIDFGEDSGDFEFEDMEGESGNLALEIISYIFYLLISLALPILLIIASVQNLASSKKVIEAESLPEDNTGQLVSSDDDMACGRGIELRDGCHATNKVLFISIGIFLILYGIQQIASFSEVFAYLGEILKGDMQTLVTYAIIFGLSLLLIAMGVVALVLRDKLRKQHVCIILGAVYIGMVLVYTFYMNFTLADSMFTDNIDKFIGFVKQFFNAILYLLQFEILPILLIVAAVQNIKFSRGKVSEIESSTPLGNAEDETK